MYKIHFSKNWRPDLRKLIHPGTYRIPGDMPEHIAQQALAAGAAVRISVDTPAAKRAPFNKALRVPENKTK